MNLTFSGKDGREFGQSSPIFGVPPRNADESPRMGARRCDPIEKFVVGVSFLPGQLPVSCYPNSGNLSSNGRLDCASSRSPSDTISEACSEPSPRKVTLRVGCLA